MTALENMTKSQATCKDLKQFKRICKGFKLFRTHYQRICYCNSDLDYTEYQFLMEDFQLFTASVIVNEHEFKLSNLQSLKKSVDMLFDKLMALRPTHSDLFKLFLSETSLACRLIIEECLNPKLFSEQFTVIGLSRSSRSQICCTSFKKVELKEEKKDDKN